MPLNIIILLPLQLTSGRIIEVIETAAWEALRCVANNFLSNTRARNCDVAVFKILITNRKFGSNMSFEKHYLDFLKFTF